MTKKVKQQSLFPDKEIESYKIKYIIKRDGRIVAFNRNKITDSIFRAAVGVGGANEILSEALTNKVIQLINETYPIGSTPTVEEIQDITEKVLVENGHFKTAKAYILYRQKHKQLREGKESRIIVEDNVPYKVLWKVYTWNIDHNCDTVEKLNKHIRDKTFNKLVDESEQVYHDGINKIANEIVKRNNKIKIVITAGPSSSGKTTTTTKIGEVLAKEKIKFVILNLDNYFKNLQEHPKDEYGDYDFETPQALDLSLINDHLFELTQGKTIKIPQYDFKSSKRTLNTTEFKLKDNEILLLDSLHGLYSEMTKSLPHEVKFKLYIETLCQLRDDSGEFVRWTDLRMFRRMVRDSWHRSYDPARTVGHWHYVRRSEMQYIVPFINKVDYIFNSALPYELSVHKKYLFRYFPEIVKKYEDDPKKVDAYIRAKRVYNLLNQIKEFDDVDIIPKNSLLREFIGGSSYVY